LRAGKNKTHNMDEHLLRYDKSKKYLFLDCETYNLCLNKCNNLPWQIAFIETNGENIVKKHNYYIKWDTDLEISKRAREITKFDQFKFDKLAVAPEIAEVELTKAIKNADYIVGHNIVGFDIYILRSFYQSLNKDWDFFSDKIIDTLALARAIKLNISIPENTDISLFNYKILNKKSKNLKTRLELLGKEYGIDHDYDNLHDALCDLELNIKVWDKIKWMINI